MMASALAAVRSPARGTVEEEHLPLERAPGDVGSQENVIEAIPIKIASWGDGATELVERRARDDRVGVGRGERPANGP